MEPFNTLNPEFYREVTDAASGLRGYIVIDRYLGGAGTGGIRFAENVTLDEVANLAYEMTLKFSYLNIRKGGAKAGFVMPHNVSGDKKESLCRKFGEGIADLLKTKKYFPGEDMGINSDDLNNILTGAGIIKPKKRFPIKGEYFTALSVFLTAQEVVKEQGSSLSGKKVIIEGFGKVGGETAKLFLRSGAVIVGISTFEGGLFHEAGLDISKLIQLKNQYGDKCVECYDVAEKATKEEILFREADIIIPGARPDVICQDNAHKFKTKIIVPISNIAATEEVEKMLAARNVKYIPGFVSNCGGILGYFLNEQGFEAPQIEKIFRKGFSRKVRSLLQKAERSGLSIPQAARIIARNNFEVMKNAKRAGRFKRMNLGRIGYVTCKKLKKKNIHVGTTYVMRKYMERVLLSR